MRGMPYGTQTTDALARRLAAFGRFGIGGALRQVVLGVRRLEDDAVRRRGSHGRIGAASPTERRPHSGQARTRLALCGWSRERDRAQSDHADTSDDSRRSDHRSLVSVRVRSQAEECPARRPPARRCRARGRRPA